jgi:hypothetical protein
MAPNKSSGVDSFTAGFLETLDIAQRTGCKGSSWFLEWRREVNKTLLVLIPKVQNP